MKIFEAGKVNCAFGVRPENAFPMKEEWLSTAEKERDPLDLQSEGQNNLNFPSPSF
jgi:hypothetical protein